MHNVVDTFVVHVGENVAVVRKAARNGKRAVSREGGFGEWSVVHDFAADEIDSIPRGEGGDDVMLEVISFLRLNGVEAERAELCVINDAARFELTFHPIRHVLLISRRWWCYGCFIAIISHI